MQSRDQRLLAQRLSGSFPFSLRAFLLVWNNRIVSAFLGHTPLSPPMYKARLRDYPNPSQPLQKKFVRRVRIFFENRLGCLGSWSHKLISYENVVFQKNGHANEGSLGSGRTPSGGSDVGSWEAVEVKEGDPTRWIPDHAVVACMGCETRFWVACRKHHCRYVFQYLCFVFSVLRYPCHHS